MIVQGNIAQEVKWREESRVPILRRYVEATREAALAAPVSYTHLRAHET